MFMVNKTLTFPKESPDIFRIFIDFLKTGRLCRPNSDEQFSFGTLLDVHTFAGEFDIILLRNAALDAFLLRLITKPHELPYHRINDIYRKISSSSSLRDLMVDVIVNIGSKQEMKDWEHDLPKAFVMDCLTVASDKGVFPFAAGEDVVAWLQNKKEGMCMGYHIHNDENEGKPTQRALPFPMVKAKVTSNIFGRPTHADLTTSKAGSWHWNGKGQRVEDDEEDWSAGEEPIAMNEQQRRFDEESAERMRVIYEPLPPETRY
jgi:hypothetical protein